MPAALIFDFDGTLAHSWRAIQLAINEIAPKHGARVIPESEWDSLRSLTMRQLLKRYGIASWRLPIMMWQIRRALVPHFATVKPFEFMAQAVSQLSAEGVQLGILTSNKNSIVEQFCARYFPPVFTFIRAEAGLFGKAKKLRRIMHDFNLDPAHTAYVGDENRDIEAAQAVGIRSIAVTWGFADSRLLESQNPTYLISEPQQLLPIARSLLT